MFITLEGIDRSGKTTQAAMLASTLGSEAILLREPGGTEVGEQIRSLLKDPALELDAAAELLLFCAARAELCARIVRPALDAGRDVVCDRFTDSTLAYQGIGRGLGIETVQALNAVATAGCVPDLTVLLRLEPEQAERRGQQRLGDGEDRFEGEGIDFQRRVAAAYDEIAARNPDRVAVVDAATGEEIVHRRVVELVEERR